MKSSETGVEKKSNLYFSSPSARAKRLFYYVISAGHYFCNSSYHLLRNSYNSILIAYIISGNLSVVLNGNEVVIRKNEILLLNCYEAHEYYASDQLEFVWIHVDGCNTMDFYNEIIKENGNVIRSFDSQVIEQLMLSVCESLKDNRIINENELSFTIYRILSLLSLPSSCVIGGTSPLNEAVEAAKQYISAHYSEEVSVLDIADQIPISQSHFYRIFKKYTGMTPYEYLQITRLNAAKEYLQKTSMSVSQISSMVGFQSDANFIYFFKHHTGVSPNKFRKFDF